VVTPRAVVVAGVAGSGKTTVGRELARRLGWTFLDGDDYHLPEHRARMARGEGLGDAEREPWLHVLRQAVEAHLDDGRSVVLACSALRARYRVLLADGRPDVSIVMLDVPERSVAERLARRRGHFFAPEGLRSQFDSLEAPSSQEEVVVVDADQSVEAVVAEVLRWVLPSGSAGWG
jgi:gluconokinase